VIVIQREYFQCQWWRLVQKVVVIVHEVYLDSWYTLQPIQLIE